jgi:ribosomal protein L11 methyltransferase
VKETFFEVTVRLPAELAEAAELALIEAGAEGTAQVLTPAAVTEVTGYFTRGEPPTATELREQVRAWCRQALGSSAEASPSIEVDQRSRPWEDWVTRTRQVLGPFDATARLRIVPPWAIPPELPPSQATPAGSPTEGSPSRATLVIEPGQAFGIGTHATTRGCLELLEAWADRGSRGAVLDIGTGTGLLALRAIQLGFRPVVALDHDPLAALDARRNARHNRMPDALALLAGEVRALRPGTGFDLILANLHLNPLLDLGSWFAERLRSGGGLIVSGFETGDAAELEGALRSHGFEPVSAVVREAWVAAAFRAPCEGAGLATRPRR